MNIHLKGNARQRRKQRRQTIQNLMSYEVLVEQKRGQLTIIRDEEEKETIGSLAS